MMKKIYILAILLAASFNANAALLSGKTVNYQYYFPNLSSPYANSDNGNKVVGAGIEVSNITDNVGTMDISDSNLYVDFTSAGSFNPGAFNGFKITDVFNDIADFTSVSIAAVTNMAGFSLSNITVLANEIWVNWAGLAFNSDTIVSLDIQSSPAPNAVPVPAALFMFAPALLAFFGLRRRTTTIA